MRKTDIYTLIEAVRILSQRTFSDDAVIEMTLREASERMDDMLCCILARIPVACRKENRYDDLVLCHDCPNAGLCKCLGGYDDGL